MTMNIKECLALKEKLQHSVDALYEAIAETVEPVVSVMPDWYGFESTTDISLQDHEFIRVVRTNYESGEVSTIYIPLYIFADPDPLESARVYAAKVNADRAIERLRQQRKSKLAELERLKKELGES